jgi:CHAT domain-containing protein/peptidoglycan hydrolase-like protein with peptidoglycan-binding domain
MRRFRPTVQLILVLAMLAVTVAPPPLSAAEFGLAERLRLQQALVAKGFVIEGANGTFGPRTKAAVMAYQKSLGHAASGTLTAEEAEALLAGQAAPAGFELVEDVDLPENDYRMGIGKNADPQLKNIDLAQCEAICASEGQCQAFTYNVSARVCFLKTTGATATPFKGAISGRRLSGGSRTTAVASAPEGQTVPLFERLEGADLPGNDIRVNGRLGVSTYSATRCQIICEETSGCTAYTYNEEARICFPKSQASSPVSYRGATSGRLDGARVATGTWETDPNAIAVWVRRALDGVSAARAAQIEAQYRPNYLTQDEAIYQGAERNYVIARNIIAVLNDRIYDSNLGMGDATRQIGDLYRYGMFDVADDLTAAIADSEIFKMGLWNQYHSPGSAAWVVANMALGDRDYELAELALVHALGNTPRGSNDKFRLALLEMLMRSRDESGDYPGAVAIAQEATAMISAGASGADEQMAKMFADMASSGSSTEVRVTSRLAALREEFGSALEAACGSEDDLLPAIPEEFKGRDPAAQRHLLELAPRYVDCGRGAFENKALTNYPLPTTFPVASFASDYILALATLDDRPAIDGLLTRLVKQLNSTGKMDDAEVMRLISTAEATNLTASKRMETARSILVGTRLDWVMQIVSNLHRVGRADEASLVLDRLLEQLDEGVIRELADPWRDNKFLIYVYALKGPERFLELQSYAPTVAAGDHCRWPTCEVEVLRARAENRLSDLEENIGWLQNGYVLAFSGTSADATEIDSIKEGAVVEATFYSRLGLHDIADGYFEVAEVTPEKLLADTQPIDALDDIEAADAYVASLIFRGDTATANRLARHVVSATQARAEAGATFSDDTVVRWAGRLEGIFRNYLATLSWDETGLLTADHELALFALQFLQMTPTATTFTKVSARMQGSGSELIRSQQDLGRQLSAAYADLASSDRPGELLKEIADLEEQRDDLDARLRNEEPKYSSYARHNFATVASIVPALSDSEAVWLGLLVERTLYTAWIDNTVIEVRRASGSVDYEDLVARYRSSMTVAPDLATVPIDVGYQLYAQLLKPFEPRRAGKSRLILVPSATLDAIPFAALPTQQGTDPDLSPADLLANPQPWLIRETALATLPSLSAFEVLRTGTRPSAASKPFFGLGDPTYATRDGIAIPRLPETGAEVRFLAALTGAGESDLLIGDAATEDAVNSIRLDDYRVLDFATHGFIAGGVPGIDEPALALAASGSGDNMLTASEILEWSLDADMIILSACNTAASDGTPGAEGLSGLANSFFYAGARNLTVTHWSIPSGPALDIVANMIGGYQSEPELGYSTALQRAVLAMVEHPKSELEAHPVSWAGYFVVGAT